MADARKSREELLAELESLRDRNAELQARYETGLRLLVERLPVLLWTTDSDFILRYGVGGALKRLDLDPDQLVGMSMYEYFGTEDPEYPPILAHHRAILGSPSDYEFEFSGMVAWCHTAPLYRDDEIVGVIGVALDVTEHAIAVAERERLLEELRAVLDAQRPVGGLVKICSGCDSIHEVDGAWVSVERFLENHTGTRFSHGLCPHCAHPVTSGSPGAGGPNRRTTTQS